MGFLKYYHPEVAKGKYNWDYELFRIMPAVINSKSKQERNSILYNWIEKLGKVEAGSKSFIFDNTNIKLYPDINWIEDTQTLGGISKQLIKIRDAERSGKNYYVELTPNVQNPIFTNEDEYSQFEYPDTGYRLLALFRYWNIIQYYFPNRHLIGEDWKDVLSEFISLMIDSKNELEYKLYLLKLVTRINDTHANIYDISIEKEKGNNMAPLGISFVEGKAVFTRQYYTEKKISSLERGDIILKVNGEPVDSIVKRKLPYTSGSNYLTKLRNISIELLRTNDSKLSIEYKHNNEIFKDTIMCIYYRYITQDISTSRINKPLYQKLDNNIGYLYLGSMQGGEVPDISKHKGLIIDLRCYPNIEKIKGYRDFEQLYSNSISFVKTSVPNIVRPGLFTFYKTINVGVDNPNYFKGKKIILVNEQSQSHSEFMVMKYRVAPNTTIIGSTTAGADGNVSEIVLPGKVYTMISGIGIYYPDGTETQRVGIIPDIEVRPTIKGIKEGRDEVLERAIEEIMKD